MTGYTVHTGTTIQFSEGWDRIFQTSGQTRNTKSAVKPKPETKVANKNAGTARATKRKSSRGKK